MIWEGDEPGHIRRISYNELMSKVSQISNALLAIVRGPKKGMLLQSICQWYQN
jgi:acyl-coenzyme A synthetase/AMP-(fatty) acid ligase